MEYRTLASKPHRFTKNAQFVDLPTSESIQAALCFLQGLYSWDNSSVYGASFNLNNCFSRNPKVVRYEVQVAQRKQQSRYTVRASVFRYPTMKFLHSSTKDVTAAELIPYLKQLSAEILPLLPPKKAAHVNTIAQNDRASAPDVDMQLLSVPADDGTGGYRHLHSSV